MAESVSVAAGAGVAPLPHFKRHLTLLFFCWAGMSISMMLVVSVSALVGNMLAADKSLSALPIALQWGATAVLTVPASFIMRRLGRRGGFVIASGAVILGGICAMASIYYGLFWLYCVACFFVGAGTGFSWYYRFAAAEVAPDAWRSRAISLVLAGGIVSALVGPMLARSGMDLMAPYTFAGAFLIACFLQLAVLCLLVFVRIPRPSALQLQGGRPLGEIARQPKFVIAVIGGVVAYASMVLLMSITPLAMKMCGLDFNAATEVIQWHVLGMYVPAFFTGHLIRKFGLYPVMLAGGVAMVLCLGVAAAGQELIHFWVSMTLLGVGWNFLFVGATTLLTETHTVAERAKTQAFNEFCIFSVTGTATFLSGRVLHDFGWTEVALGTLPLVLVVLVAVGWLALRERRAGLA
jgi:MFS family permease